MVKLLLFLFVSIQPIASGESALQLMGVVPESFQPQVITNDSPDSLFSVVIQSMNSQPVVVELSSAQAFPQRVPASTEAPAQSFIIAPGRNLKAIPVLPKAGMLRVTFSSL